MRVTSKDIVFLCLFLIAGIIFVEVGNSIISELGNFVQIADERAIIIISVVLGVLMGFSAGLILNIETRRIGLLFLGALIGLVYHSAGILALKNFFLGLAMGTIVSVLDTFNMLETNTPKLFKIGLTALYALFLYSLLYSLYVTQSLPYMMVSQNTLILLAIGSVGFFAALKVL